MIKLSILILISLCLSICYARDCVNIYQNKPDFTVQITVEGLINSNGKDYNGEYFQDGIFTAYVTEKQDRDYEVYGSYKMSVQAIVNHPRLCKQVYKDKEEKGTINFFFTSKRKFSRVGQQYTQEEVTPNFNKLRTEILSQMAKKAQYNRESQYIVDTLEELAETSAYNSRQH